MIQRKRWLLTAEKVTRSIKQGVLFEQDWTKGSIIRNLLMLSWPIIVHEGFWVVGMTADMIWVGRLGAASIAGVGVAGIMVWVLMAVRMGISAGTRAMIARFVGAGDTEGANHVARQALVISGVYTIVMTAIGIFLAEPMLSLFGLEADVVAEGAAYMRIMFAGSLATSFWMMGEGIMQASGDAVTPMKISILIRCVHLPLAPFLIFGWWIFPSLGVSGAALTNVISQSLGTALGLWILFSGRTRLRLTLSNFRIDLNTIWRIVKIGIPAAVSGVQRTLGTLGLTWLIAPFGTLAVAAHSLAQRVEMFLFVPGMAMGMATGVLVGQNLGAGQLERAEKSGWLGVGLVQPFMVICSVAILLWAESIVRIFSPEPGLIVVASTFLRIAAAAYVVMGIPAVLMQSLYGAGDTLPPMLVSLITVWAVQLPLAFFLPQITNLGVLGVRWAMVVGMGVGAVAYVIYFRMGGWKRKRV